MNVNKTFSDIIESGFFHVVNRHDKDVHVDVIITYVLENMSGLKIKEGLDKHKIIKARIQSVFSSNCAEWKKPLRWEWRAGIIIRGKQNHFKFLQKESKSYFEFRLKEWN